MACREHDLSKIARIEAIALSKVPAIDGMSASMFALTSNMYVASSKLPMSGNIGATTPTRIMFTKDSAKLSDKDSTGVYGYSHSITFKWKWQPNTSAEFDSLMTMRRAPHCLRITYFGGTVRYVLTEQDGYLFSWNDNDGNCECEMKLTNVMGFLRVLEET